MPEDSTGPPDPDVDDLPTVTCSRCDQSWDLAYELEELQVGNQALMEFALDHHRHTGHYPDDVTPWVVDCERCPETEAYLTKTPARRWAQVHARHTRHAITVTGPDGATERVSPDTS